MIDVTLVEAADRLLGTFSHLSSGRALRTLTRRGVERRARHRRRPPDRRRASTSPTARFLPARHRRVGGGRDGRTRRGRERPRADAGRAAGGRVGPVGARPARGVRHRRHRRRGRRRRAAAAPGGATRHPGWPARRPARSSAGSTVCRACPSTTTTRAPWRRSAATRPSPSCPFGVRLWGFVGWLAWLGLHLIQLMGFRNRANVLVNWAWNYVTYDRGARLLAEADREDP